MIGEHGQGWPELMDQDGGFVGVLAPSSDFAGLARWELRGEPSALLVSCIGRVRLPG